MSISIAAKQLPLEYYDAKNVGIRWLNVLKKYEKLMLADYRSTTRTWNRKVDFESVIKFKGANPRLMVWTDDLRYYDIDGGTDIRYDVMSPDFVPKTVPGVLNSFPGEGGFAYKDFKNPRRGIEPRNFSVAITNKYEKHMQIELLEATAEGLEARKAIKP